MKTIAQSWRRIETWLHTFAPMCAALLHPGATPEELADTETWVGVALPEDVKASYRMHNGAAVSDTFRNTILAEFLSLKDMVGFWQWLQDFAKRDPGWAQHPRSPSPFQQVQAVTWHSAWLPFYTTTWERDHLCIDLAPLPGGHVGQILSWSHEDGPLSVSFTSFEDLLATYAAQVEAGLFVVEQPLLYPHTEWYFNAGRVPFDTLKERHAAFQRPSPAKPTLLRAIRSGWYLYYEDDGSYRGWGSSSLEQARGACLAMYRTILQMDQATQEDRFFAYYGLASLVQCQDFEDLGTDRDLALLEQREAEAATMSATHWVHYDVSLWKQGGYGIYSLTCPVFPLPCHEVLRLEPNRCSHRC